jgi:hypothetical protein
MGMGKQSRPTRAFVLGTECSERVFPRTRLCAEGVLPVGAGLCGEILSSSTLFHRSTRRADSENLSATSHITHSSCYLGAIM